MTNGDDIVRSARRWIGTPYRHQASSLGSGADCLGLVRGVWRDVVGQEPENVPTYTPDWAEATGEEVLLEAALRWLIPTNLTAHRSGDVVVFRMRQSSVAKHLGIASFRDKVPTIIHAYSGHGVCETPLSMPWQRKIAGRYQFPLGAK